MPYEQRAPHTLLTMRVHAHSQLTPYFPPPPIHPFLRVLLRSGCAEWTGLEHLDARGAKKNILKLPEVVFESLKRHVPSLGGEFGPTSRAGLAGVQKAKKGKGKK